MSSLLCPYCGEICTRQRYDNHVERCRIFSYYHDEDGENADNILSTYLQSNRQLSGPNINVFLRDHHSPPLRRSPLQSPLYRAHVLQPPQQSLSTPSRTPDIPMIRRIGFDMNSVSDIETISVKVNVITDDVCSICHDNFQDVDEVRMLICTHKFCRICISKWVEKNPTCPLCKIDLKKKLIS